MMSDPSTRSPNSLAGALDLRLSQVLRGDLLVGVLGGAGGVWLAISSPDGLEASVPIAAALVGIVIGAVIAGVAIMAAFLDQSFLRKVREIGKEPVRYLKGFLFTAVLGVVAALALLVLSALPSTTTTWVLAIAAGIAGLAATWALASVIPNLGTLVQFIGLQFDASEVPEIRPSAPQAGHEDQPSARRV